MASDKQCNNETDEVNKHNNDNSEAKDTFSDPRYLYGSYREMSTFSNQSEVSPVTDTKENEPMTPQKQFLLLSQSLRHPDGSSNPDLTSGRSPGNGQSSSDQEDEVAKDLLDDNDNSNEIINTNDSNVKQIKKNELTFAARLMRLFSSKRNKNKIFSEKRSQSCDRELETSPVEKKTKSKKDVRSASASPLKQRQKKKNGRKEKSDQECLTPVSCLSLAPTEWEFQVQDVVNGNGGGYQRQKQTVSQSGDRKSSGYDSLEGESSSLDSSNDISDTSLIVINGNSTIKYAVPNDITNNENTINYDDITALKMEIKRHPNILRQAY